MKKSILFVLACIVSLCTYAAQHTYTLFSDGMPSDAVVIIKGQEFRGLNAQGDQQITCEELAASDITIKVGGGYLGKAVVDNANYQVNVKFIAFFTPTDSIQAEKKYEYLLKMPSAYVKKNGSNLNHTKVAKEADRFIFIQKEQGQYYIYDTTAGGYIYYSNASNGSSVKVQTSSNVKYTTNVKIANTWQLLMLSESTVAIIPGSIENPTTKSPAWNFTGGIDNNCVLNLYTANDANSAWEILDPSAGTMPCATLVYSKPGAPFMHKLVTNSGETVVSVDFGNITTLELKDDRINRGNKYKYISGTAPTTEGSYIYTVHITDATKEEKTVKVEFIVSNFLQSPTPMMAWLTWNWFARSISHDKMVAIAEGMQKHGLVDAGFNTIVLDDAWGQQGTDKSALTYDATKFPQGISGLKTALKAINPKFKVGIYSDAGSMTCENYQPGSYNYEAQHIALFDSWGVDMLKYDYCNSQASTKISYTQMGNAIKALNNNRKVNDSIPFVFNICEWGKTQPWIWGAQAGGSSWRSTSDAREDWIGNNSRPGVLGGVDETRRLWMYAGVNRFNDLDMMCIGLHGLGGPSNNTKDHQSNGGKITGLTDKQARTQMSLWCMLASPLSLTCDLRAQPQGEANKVTLPSPLITDADITTLTNTDILAINQDALGQQAEYMEALSTGTTNYATTGYDVYVKDLTDGRFAVSITNRASSSLTSKTFNLEDLYMESGKEYTCYDVWKKTTSTVKDSIKTGIFMAYETRVYVLTPNATAVRDVQARDTTTAKVIYDLTGQQIDSPQKGIHIVDGKKVIY